MRTTGSTHLLQTHPICKVFIEFNMAQIAFCHDIATDPGRTRRTLGKTRYDLSFIARVSPTVGFALSFLVIPALAAFLAALSPTPCDLC